MSLENDLTEKCYILIVKCYHAIAKSTEWKRTFGQYVFHFFNFALKFASMDWKPTDSKLLFITGMKLFPFLFFILSMCKRQLYNHTHNEWIQKYVPRFKTASSRWTLFITISGLTRLLHDRSYVYSQSLKNVDFIYCSIEVTNELSSILMKPISYHIWRYTQT